MLIKSHQAGSSYVGFQLISLPPLWMVLNNMATEWGSGPLEAFLKDLVWVGEAKAASTTATILYCAPPFLQVLMEALVSNGANIKEALAAIPWPWNKAKVQGSSGGMRPTVTK